MRSRTLFFPRTHNVSEKELIYVSQQLEDEAGNAVTSTSFLECPYAQMHVVTLHLTEIAVRLMYYFLVYLLLISIYFDHARQLRS